MMKYFSFKIVALSIVLPPILYILTISYMERYTEGQYYQKIESIYTGDSSILMEGRLKLTDVIAANIDSFLESQTLIALGMDVSVTVHTKKGLLLYPVTGEMETYDFQSSDSIKIAEENLDLLNQGLILKINVILPHNTYLANIIFAAYLFATVVLLYVYFNLSQKKFLKDNMVTGAELQRLKRLESEYDEKYHSLEIVKKELAEELTNVSNQLNKSVLNEDGMIDEIVALEDKIKEEHELTKKQREEIEELTEALEKINSSKKSKKKKSGENDFFAKRCKAIFKNLIISDRVIGSYFDLEGDKRIKCEEVFMKINNNPADVKIKRKVFGPKGAETVFEVVFGYKGRLYYRKLKNGKIEIIALGTKNSQAKELDFLHKL